MSMVEDPMIDLHRRPLEPMGEFQLVLLDSRCLIDLFEPMR